MSTFAHPFVHPASFSLGRSTQPGAPCLTCPLLQLIPKDLHNAVRHTGGYAIWSKPLNS
ncbi:HNH endonuclease [Corynebacterium qintianiae]|uniref:HNH endonuclease n=1 Tax=Corynebacterium qintianiae TaxID=2709392 RepID=A0A7T0PEW8_9CORY|nr:HNH endonuclease [Corynebacterium qintianiae]